MSLAHDFEYIKPSSVDETVKLLSDFGEKAKVLSGGTDLLVKIKEGIDFPDVLIDIKGLKELKKIELNNNILFIGANVTFTELIESSLIKEKYFMIWESSGTVASVGTRNRATIVGNICSAVPSLDSAPALLCYNAEVLVKSKDSERTISIHDWFVGPKKTALKSNEFVVGLKVPLIAQKNGAVYSKLGRYAGEDLAQAGLGIIALENNEYRVAYCAVGPVPKRSKQIEDLLKGKSLTPELIAEVQEISSGEISPITDIRASKEYRIHMIQVMLERGLKTAVDRMM